MHPRTVAVVGVVLLAGAIGLRLLAVHLNWLPVSDEVVLKKAVAISVRYHNGQKFKTLHISDPAEVREVLAQLHMPDDRDHYYGFARTMVAPTDQPAISFHFPDGSRRDHILDQMPYQGFEVNTSFYDKLSEVVSRHEGKRVKVRPNPPPMNWGAFQGGMPGRDDGQWEDKDKGKDKD